MWPKLGNHPVLRPLLPPYNSPSLPEFCLTPCTYQGVNPHFIPASQLTPHQWSEPHEKYHPTTLKLALRASRMALLSTHISHYVAAWIPGSRQGRTSSSSQLQDLAMLLFKRCVSKSECNISEGRGEVESLGVFCDWGVVCGALLSHPFSKDGPTNYRSINTHSEEEKIRLFLYYSW